MILPCMFVRDKKIGEGISASVFSTKCGKAIKIFDQCSTSIDDYRNEIDVSMKLPKHPNTMSVIHHGIIGGDERKGEGDERGDEAYIVYDLMSGTVDNLIMNLDEAKFVSREMFRAIASIHSVGLMHCDVKPQNILWRNGAPNGAGVGAMAVRGEETNLPMIKLTDFGLTSPCDGNYKTFNVGTIQYNAPENIICVEYDQSIDIWSGFASTFNFVTGEDLFEVPYLDDDEDENTETEMNDAYHILREIEKYIGKPSKQHLKIGRNYYNANGNLKYDPESFNELENNINLLLRFEELLEPGDAEQYFDFLTWGLKTNPKKRPTIKEVLEHDWLNSFNPENISFPLSIP